MAVGQILLAQQMHHECVWIQSYSVAHVNNACQRLPGPNLWNPSVLLSKGNGEGFIGGFKIGQISWVVYVNHECNQKYSSKRPWRNLLTEGKQMILLWMLEDV